MNGERFGCAVSVSIVCCRVSVQGSDDDVPGPPCSQGERAISGAAASTAHGPPSSTSGFDERARVRLAQGSVAVSGAAGERRAARWGSSRVQEMPSARARPVVARSAIGAA